MSTSIPRAERHEARRLHLFRLLFAVCVASAWEIAGRSGAGIWISRPSAIGARLWVWIEGDLWIHLSTTLLEMLIGLAVGVPLGVLCGLLLGRAPVVSRILRPVIVSIYNIPMIALAPLLILCFGLDLMPKVVLVAIVTFFILFFATFSGSESIDPDWFTALGLMGANRREQFRKLVLPASAAWIASAMRLALPYALIDATMGEMLAARRGLGFLLTDAIAQVDMTGVYAALVILMGVGVTMVMLANKLERLCSTWRQVKPQPGST